MTTPYGAAEERRALRAVLATLLVAILGAAAPGCDAGGFDNWLANTWTVPPTPTACPGSAVYRCSWSIGNVWMRCSCGKEPLDPPVDFVCAADWKVAESIALNDYANASRPVTPSTAPGAILTCLLANDQSENQQLGFQTQSLRSDAGLVIRTLGYGGAGGDGSCDCGAGGDSSGAGAGGGSGVGAGVGGSTVTVGAGGGGA